MGRWQAELEHRQAFLGTDRGHRCGAVCHGGLLQPGRDAAPAASGSGASPTNSPRPSASSPACASDEYFDRLWRNTDDPDQQLARKALAGDYTWLEAGIIDLSEGTGPWIAEPGTGPSTRENQHRRYR